MIDILGFSIEATSLTFLEANGMLRAWLTPISAFLALTPTFAAGNEIDGRFYPQTSQP
jgi:hypothetical protein